MTGTTPRQAARTPGITEQGALRFSIATTPAVAALGIVFGWLSGSFAIVFDGVYSLVDGAMTMIALLVSRLIAGYAAVGAQDRRFADRFTMGFWHLEPMVLALNGLMLSGAAVYAFINAVGSLFDGGRPLQFGQAIVYAAITLLACSAMSVFALRVNRRLRSQLVALDAKGWMMSGAITAALLLAFVGGALVEGTALAWIAPYIDPAVLALVCVVIIPMPLGTIRQALADILLVTPVELKREVDAVAAATVARHGFLSYRAYVARVGRGRQIELYFIVPAGLPARTLEAWDAIRDEVGDALGAASPDRWLTIVFTSDIEWAE